MPAKRPSTPFDERAQHLLKVLVQRHIRDGQPVGSRTLTRESGLDLSAASIRNIMADLEELGYVRSPHTSAGRVPTDKGYRYFVDCLLTVEPAQLVSGERFNVRLDTAPDAEYEDIVDSASSLLSGLTRLAGVVTLPRRRTGVLRHLEFLPLDKRRVLAILVVNDHEVQNRVLHLERDYPVDELQRVANYLNAHYAGQRIEAVREALLCSIEDDRQRMDVLMASVLELGGQALTEPRRHDDDYVVAGQTNLMSFEELSADVQRLRNLFNAFAEKRDILHLLDQCVLADGIQIFIGEESGYRVFDGCSLVTTPYSAEGEVLGVLGVIGPTRMEYGRVIPIVDLTAKLLGAALKQQH
jgi:heat-inducible transcriptional repressor